MQGRTGLLSCATSDTTICEAPCVLEGQKEVTCESNVGFQAELAVGPNGEPWLLADSFRYEDAPTLIDVAGGTAAKVASVGVSSALMVDASNATHIFHTTESPNARLLDRQTAGDEILECLAGPTGYWVPRNALMHGENLFLLATWGNNGGGGLVLATRDSELDWSTEDLEMYEVTGESMVLATDGTPIIGAFVTGSSGWEARVRVGASPAEPVPFDVANEGVHPLVIFPGASSWSALGWVDAAGFTVGTPDENTFVVPGTARVAPTGCESAALGCSGTCTETGVGVARELPVIVQDGSAFLLFFIELAVERTRHFEGDVCTMQAGPPCECEGLTDSDDTTGDLIAIRVDPATKTSTPVLRVPLGSVSGNTSVQAKASGGSVAVLVENSRPDPSPTSGNNGPALLATIPLSALQ